eukprot:1638955-Alexandrium_andersonii.AAC.1
MDLRPPASHGLFTCLIDALDDMTLKVIHCKGPGRSLVSSLVAITPTVTNRPLRQRLAPAPGSTAALGLGLPGHLAQVARHPSEANADAQVAKPAQLPLDAAQQIGT